MIFFVNGGKYCFKSLFHSTFNVSTRKITTSNIKSYISSFSNNEF